MATQPRSKARAAPRIDVLFDASTLRDALQADVMRGLGATPKELPPRWLYDRRGSELFEEITRLPEYYPTRRERRILSACADELASIAPAQTLVELGSGSSEKTRILIDALAAGGTLGRFMPVDVSESALRGALGQLALDYPRLELHGLVADFEHQLEALPPGEQRLVAFLGSTIGNLDPAARRRFLEGLAAALAPGEWLLLGLDLVKDAGRLERAYDDTAGVTAAFNLNLLARLNRELTATFDLDSFAHVARYDREHDWIEMVLRSTREQVVEIAGLGLEVRFGEGEELRTEISAKFRRGAAEQELERAGFDLLRWWTDPAGDFAVALFARNGAT